MKTTRQAFTHLSSIALTVGTLSACGGGAGNSSPDPQTSDTDNAVTINATAGGRGASANDPANKYTYFNLTTNAVVELTDAEAETSSDWHIGFKRTNVKLNSGVSGPANVKGAVADAQNEFYDNNGDPNNSVFLNANAASALVAFDAVTGTDGLSFVEDRNIPYIKGDGSSEGWWLYAGPPTHAVSANPDRWWLIKSAAANSYAKFNVSNIVQASRNITLDLFIQGASESVFSNSVTQWTAAIGAAGGSKCFDIDTVAEVDCTTAASDWDIKVEAAGQSWNIWTNGGVSGSGNGGAFGSFDATSIVNYTSGTVTVSGTGIRRMYGQDSAGGLFKDNTWYAYSLEGNNKLWPNYRVYAIDTGTDQYKLQILSFYDDAGVSGMIKIRYESL
ncbi:MAG TPA: hypothetical protein ENK04_13330 [Gammaproteobacteria bacterium]|nr:hypothetical protein [Gammaproteobacteria bacterium]